MGCGVAATMVAVSVVVVLRETTQSWGKRAVVCAGVTRQKPGRVLGETTQREAKTSDGMARVTCIVRTSGGIHSHFHTSSPQAHESFGLQPNQPMESRLSQPTENFEA